MPPESRSKSTSRAASARARGQIPGQIPGAICDVAIIGGGLVGASLACALAPLGLNVALVEAVQTKASEQPSYDDRTLALSAASCRILKGLDLWNLLELNATPIRSIQVTEANRPGCVVMRPQELGLEAFGHVVEAREFGRAVMARMDALDNVLMICPASVNSFLANDELVTVSYEAGGESHQLKTRLLVGADGAESVVRNLMDIEVERHDYGQTAIICNVTPAQLHQGRAFECFTPTGPFALLPHVGGRCGLVWSVATDNVAEILAWEDDVFLNRAHALFGNALGPWSQVGQRTAYPLRLVRALNDTGPRTVILGNAAHAIHPIGAQGFNLGLRDVAVLAELIANALPVAGFDPGAGGLLDEYSAWRVPDQSGTVDYTDGLARMYANPSPVIGALRHAGLLAHALVPPLRRQLAIRAMGFRGRIPRLAQGEKLTGPGNPPVQAEPGE